MAVVCLRAIVDHVWSGTFMVLYDVFSFVAWTGNMVLMMLEIKMGGHWSWANYGFWWLAVAGESLIGWYHRTIAIHDANIYDLVLVGIFGTRYALLWIMALLSLVHIKRESREDDLDALRALDPDAPESAVASSSTPGEYGTFASAFKAKNNGPKKGDAAMGSSSEDEITKKLNAEKEERASAFKDFWPKIKKLLPFVYPKNDAWLKFMFYLVFFFIALGRLVNVLVPFQTRRVVSSLDHAEPHFDVWAILFYVFLRFLQGSSGLVNVLRGWAWIPVEQYSNSTLTIQFFEHVHNLSLQFHLNRKTGELLRILDRGTSSIVSLLSTVLFQLVPVVADVLLAVVYLCMGWGWKYALIVFITLVSYIFVTVVVTEWRTQFRRAMISFDNDARTKAVDSLLNFETVKYYSAEEIEVARYREAIRRYMVADYKSQITFQLLNLMQAFVITMGMLAGCLLCAYEIAEGTLDVSYFVTYIIYLNQLYQPLNWFGSYYRMLQQNFVDMEKMLELLNQNQSVKDIPGADKLLVSDGEVVFENVSFQYDSRQKGLKDISFRVPKGKTVALVGPTGSGKSTILRLLFRFYDVSSGRILIDGQDIATKTQASLRKQIGVVPQDSVLFNDSIYYNINYGRASATKEEIEEAAKAAQIHDKILDFPDGYSTKVGERGLRLSGGEKQRVAIARTILKNPPIVLLDEATSALDSTTESQIQAALVRMTENRTTFVVAHRLSTIVNSDLILCIKDGVIVERGTHNQLVEEALRNGGKGVYYEMWRQQIREEQSEGSTVEGSLSENSDSRSKDKEVKDPPRLRQEGTPSTLTTEPTELTEVVVESSTPESSASAAPILGSKDASQAPEQGSSRPASSSSSPKSPLTASERARLRKKKTNKKK
ncbi:Homocysteine S-methyltransferase 1 [Haplosporangium sp. Z 11]|nr:Homocysteine S-methyltransferase 1 [Haplosporangium sp. Z 11]